MDRVECTCNKNFEGNIIIVGQTRCGKTKFVQNLAKVICSVNLKTFFGSQKFPFHQREKITLEAVFVEFKYPNNIEKILTCT